MEHVQQLHSVFSTLLFLINLDFINSPFLQIDWSTICILNSFASRHPNHAKGDKLHLEKRAHNFFGLPLQWAKPSSGFCRKWMKTKQE
jgi:hypothetical protein